MATSTKNPFSQAVALTLSGAGIGWLAGISVSPVAAGLIAFLTGLLGVLAAAGSGISHPTTASHTGASSLLSSVNAWPAALITIAIVIGVAGGIKTRTSRLLGAHDTFYVSALSSDSADRLRAALPVLFAAQGPTSLCTTLSSRLDRPGQIRNLLQSSEEAWLATLEQAVTEDRELIQILEGLCRD